MSIVDYNKVLRNNELLVEKIENIFDDYYKITLVPKRKLTWIPGQYGIFKIRGRKIDGKPWRAFSILSVPEEGKIIIATRVGTNISSFKSNLISLTKGDMMTMRGPLGGLALHNDMKPVIMIGLGIGATPLIALSKKSNLLFKRGFYKNTIFVYASSTGYVLKDELMSIDIENDYFKFYPTTNAEETENCIIELCELYGSEAHYIVSGSTSNVKEIRSLLISNGIDKKLIHRENFYGY